MLLYKSGIISIERSGNELVKKIDCVRPFSFAKNTTYGLGGQADVCYYPKNIPQAVAVYDYLTRNNIDLVTLGNGSNVLASDKNYRGAVVCTRRMKGIIRLNEKTLFCLSGTTTSELIKYCIDHKLTGLEYVYGIPATLGGLVYMNGGAGGRYIGSNVSLVKVYNGKLINFSNKSCDFSYKHSTMRDINCPVLGVCLTVSDAQPEIIEENLNYFRQLRKHLPKGKSCGCYFKNPDGISAGKLIDGAQLKGLKVGGAYVSPQHANFIINDNATAEDVVKLVSIIKRKVFEKYGVNLEEEVVYIGEFNDFNC